MFSELPNKKHASVILLCLSLNACALLGTSTDKKFIGTSRELDTSNPKTVSTEIQLTKLHGNNIELTLNQQILYPYLLAKHYSVTKTDYGESHPFEWLFLTSWNPFIWISGDIFGYKELFGIRYSSTQSVTEYLNDGSTKLIEGTPKNSIDVNVSSSQICKNGCRINTTNGKGVFSLTKVLVDNNIISSDQLADENSADFKFVASIPYPGGNVEKTITVSSLADNVEEAKLIVARQKEAEEQARQQEAIRQEEKRVREKEALAQSNNGNLRTDLSGLNATANEKKVVPTTACPTTLQLTDRGKTIQLEVRALSEKLYTKDKLESYYAKLLSSLQKAKAQNIGAYGSFLQAAYTEEYALYGCTKGYGRDEYKNNICGELIYNKEYSKDTISPRIELYRCHKNLGWPSASSNGLDEPKKQLCNRSDINNGQQVHGITFKILNDDMVEGTGGPCRVAGVEKMSLSLPSVALYAKNPNIEPHYSVVGQFPYSGNDFSFPFVDDELAKTTLHYKRKLREYEAVGNPAADGVREALKLFECVEMNHQKFAIALKDWIAANSNNLKNCSGY